MKFRYLLPFLIMPFLPLRASAQSTIEANNSELDVKSEYVDLSLEDSLGFDKISRLEKLVNLEGQVRLKFLDNSAYFQRNGLLNHLFGGDIAIGPFGTYYNKSQQGIESGDVNVENTQIGELITETNIKNQNVSEEYGVSFDREGFSIGYDFATENNEIDGSTIITLNGEDVDRVPFSVSVKNETEIFGFGFPHGFIKGIRNVQEDSVSERFFAGLNYSFGGSERDRFRTDIYYLEGEGLSGYFELGIFRDIDLGINYIPESGFGFVLSNSDYSRLNREDFERSMENRLRSVDRIHDENLEIRRERLGDMFFTEPFAYTFSISEEEINASVNLMHFLFHYSQEGERDKSIKVGLREGPFIATYDFKQKELKFGLFFEQ